MAMLPNGAFNANAVDPSQDFEPVPSGEYLAMITDSLMKPTKNGAGAYLEVTLTIQDGPCKGRLVWDRLNLINRSNQAVEIAQRTLSSICHAINVMNVTDSAQLHNKPMRIRVSYVEQNGYQPKNEVKAYKSAKPQAAPVSTPQQQATPRQAASSAPPWAS